MRSEREKELLGLLERIQAEIVLAKRATNYKGLAKSINILQNEDRNGYAKIGNHLLNDFRMLYDNRHDTETLNENFDRACKLAENLSKS